MVGGGLAPPIPQDFGTEVAISCAGRTLSLSLATSAYHNEHHYGSLEMGLFTILGWMLFGLIIGALARLVVPGRQRMGLLMTMLLGIVGSFVGGFLGSLLMGGDPVQASGWIGSLIGAVILVGLYSWSNQRRVTHRSH